MNHLEFNQELCESNQLMIKFWTLNYRGCDLEKWLY